MKKLQKVLMVLMVLLLIPLTNVAHGQNNPTAEQLLTQGQAVGPYDAMEIYQRGYLLYPGDARFKEGIHNSANTILRWSKSSHDRGTFVAAINGYTFLIDTPNLQANIIDQAHKFRQYAEANKTLPTADQLANKAKGKGPYDAMEIHQEGYLLYPGDARFKEGIDNSASTILRWSKSSHSRGSFPAAINGYTVLINTPNVHSSITDEAKRFRQYAMTNKTLYTAAELVNKAKGKGPYDAMEIHQEGYLLYPDDARFKEGIEIAASTIMRWSKSSHSRRTFPAAISGYDFLINTPNLHSSIKAEAQRFKQHAMENKTLYTEDQLINSAKNKGHYDAMEIYQEGYFLYPQDARFKSSINAQAQTIYEIGLKDHNQGIFYGAIDTFEKLLKYPYIPNDVKQKAQQTLKEARGSLIIVNENFQVMFTHYPRTFEEALNIQMSRNPQTDSYGGGWKTALRDDTSYFLNPVNFAIRDFSNIEATYKVQVNTQTLRVRSGPSTDHEQVGRVSLGQAFEYLKQENGWYQIYYLNGTGWVHGDFVTEIVEEIPVSMFQFLVLSGSAGVTAQDLNGILQGKGILQNTGQAFIEAGKKNNINEIYLVSHALLETGNGGSRLATGILVDQVDGVAVEPRVVYNMFGIGAHDRDPIRLGSEYAYKQGWFTPQKSIIDGAHWISAMYVNNPTYRQDTLYKMRWNPQTPGIHQYATDIGWAAKQTYRIKQLYDQCKTYTLRFDIPSYNK